MRPRTNNFLEQLKSKRDAAKQAETAASAPAPAPVPVSEFSDPAVQAEDFKDRLAESRRELEAERERRRAAESRAAKLETESHKMNSGRAALSTMFSKRRRPPWR